MVEMMTVLFKRFVVTKENTVKPRMKLKKNVNKIKSMIKMLKL